jgi:hypothetical protein
MIRWQGWRTGVRVVAMQAGSRLLVPAHQELVGLMQGGCGVVESTNTEMAGVGGRGWGAQLWRHGGWRPL